MLELDDQIRDKCNEAIIISGGARSGTTIMGKILHTFNDVEYSFEPPLFFSLFALINELQADSWKLLYETYLYEEFLMSSLAGRGLNCNKADDSSIYKVKPLKLIEARLNNSLRKVDAERLACNSRIAFKMPDIVPFLPQLKKYYPETRMIIMVREAPDTFNSILEKGWFSDRTLKGKNVLWPNRFLNGIRIPFWVAPEEDYRWVEMDELHRIAYYYLRVNRPLNNIKDRIIMKYSALMDDPSHAAKKLSESLGLDWGEKTADVLASIHRRRTRVDDSILKKLMPGIREEVEYYSGLSHVE